MEGVSKEVRLVRCPKCENVLPELPHFSLYKCGGCGAILRANKQGSRSDDLYEKSDDEKGKGVPEKEKQICDKTISLIDSSSSKAEDKVFVKVMDQTSRAETMNLHHDQGNQEGDGVFFDGRYNTYSRGRFDNRVHKNGHVENAKREFSNFSHPRERSSNYSFNFPHDFGEHKRVENLEHDRAELLRKIDELKIQLGTPSDAREKPRDISPINRTMDRHLYINNSYVPEGPCRANLQPFATDQNVLDPIYGDYKQGHASNMGNIYPPNRVVRSSYQQPYHDQFPGYNIGLNQNNSGFNIGLNQKIHAPQNSVGFVKGPQCSCYRCYRNWQVQSRVQQTTVESTQQNISSGYGLHGHNLGSSSDFDFNNGILNGGLVRRAVIARGIKKICHPRAGGAPFLACPTCFVLLEFPKNLTRGTRNGNKILCGACSELLSVKIENNGIVFTIPTKLRQVSAEDVKNLDDYLKVNECDNSTVNLLSPNEETNALSGDHSIKSGRSSERRGLVSSSSSFSEAERSPDSVIIVRENSESADLAMKDDPPLGEDSGFADLPSKDDSPPPLQHHPQNTEPDDDFADFVFSRCGMGNRSKRAPRQNLAGNNPMVMEKEVVYSDVAVSTEVSEEEDQLTLHEESESFFGGFIKKSIKNLLRPSQSAEMSRINVFVNGQPLSNRVVRKAEKLAGPIEPGNYWYDNRAGFWGVMGQPCHGIIPPFIEEFNYSMPRNCAAGNTGVFVNGRELHDNDLDLLASRGLPTTRNKFYMIEISGRVVDEYTGEELDDLGKLAPTVEKVKHGFGMRPRATVE